ncbi:MAG: alpha/beta fold hydrolase [Actinoallomurus sp.]
MGGHELVRRRDAHHRGHPPLRDEPQGPADVEGGLEHHRGALPLITFDNRGIGDSDAPPGPYDSATMAADAVAVLDAVGVRRAHVLGASLGGVIAQMLALDHPHQVDRLILACTTPGGAEAYPRLAWLPDEGHLFFWEDPDGTVERVRGFLA